MRDAIVQLTINNIISKRNQDTFWPAAKSSKQACCRSACAFPVERVCKTDPKSIRKSLIKKIKKQRQWSCSASAQTWTFNHNHPIIQNKKNKSTWRPQGSRMPVLQTRWLGDWSFLFGAPWHLFLHPKPPEAPNSSAPSRRSLGCFPSNVFLPKKTGRLLATFCEREASTKQRSNLLIYLPNRKHQSSGLKIVWCPPQRVLISFASKSEGVWTWRRPAAVRSDPGHFLLGGDRAVARDSELRTLRLRIFHTSL